MRVFSGFIIALVAGCVQYPTAPVTVLTPAISKEGMQSFTFITTEQLPIHYPKGTEARKAHEELIAIELGKRQYCLKGYEIVSVEPWANEYLKYNGLCKP